MKKMLERVRKTTVSKPLAERLIDAWHHGVLQKQERNLKGAAKP